MIKCRLEELLKQLPPPPKADTAAKGESGPDEAENNAPPHNKMSLRSHAEAAGIGWQQFSGLLHNHTQRPALDNLQKARNYLAAAGLLEPGEVRFSLGETLQERGVTKSDAKDLSGVSYSALQRMTKNQLSQVSYDVVDRVLTGLELKHIGQVIDAGGLLAWVQ